jgi:adenylate cyclase
VIVMPSGSLQFAAFTLDLDRLRLEGPAGPVALRPKNFEVLRYLAERAGRVVGAPELLDAVWPGVTVTDESLTRCISEIRQALADDQRRIVKTVPKRGYLLDLPVSTEPTALALPDRPSIAVLPFANLSGDPAQNYFAQGVVDEIITALSRIRWLFVIARNSSLVYSGELVDVRQVGRELGVRYVLQGSIRRSADRLRVTGKLVDATSGAHIWGERYDGTLQDIFALQDEITLGVAGAIEPHVRLAELERTRLKPTDSLDAYDLYLRALPLLRPLERNNSAVAERLLRKAVEIDGNYPDALALLADVLVRRTVNTWIEDWAAGMAEAREFAWRAVVADPTSGFALAAAAFTYVLGGFGLAEAKDFADRALARHPMSAAVRAYVGWTYMYLGESDVAISHLELARRMSPIDPHSFVITLVGMAGAHLYARRFDRAVAAARQALNVSPEHTGAGRYLAAALAHDGRIEEARLVVKNMVLKNPLLTIERQRRQTLGHPWMMDLFVDGLRKAGLPER